MARFDNLIDVSIRDIVGMAKLDVPPPQAPVDVKGVGERRSGDPFDNASRGIASATASTSAVPRQRTSLGFGEKSTPRKRGADDWGVGVGDFDGEGEQMDDAVSSRSPLSAFEWNVGSHGNQSGGAAKKARNEKLMAAIQAAQEMMDFAERGEDEMDYDGEGEVGDVSSGLVFV